MVIKLITITSMLLALGAIFVNPVQGQILEEGNFLIEGYVGFPNL